MFLSVAHVFLLIFKLLMVVIHLFLFIMFATLVKISIVFISNTVDTHIVFNYISLSFNRFFLFCTTCIIMMAR